MEYTASLMPYKFNQQNSTEELLKLHAHIKDNQDRIGYPCNLNFDMSFLKNLTETPLYNIGVLSQDDDRKSDTDSYARSTSIQYERKVLKFVADLYQFPENEEWFGYVGSGGTEGNIFGLQLAREAYPDGIVYYSKDSHYSIAKAVKLLRMDSCQVPSMDNGEIDYDVLESIIQDNLDAPVILSLNIGSTMKGAIDHVGRILEILQRNKIRDHYIHCDAALFGMMLPFLEDGPRINFQLPIDSIAMSGHKFIGTPMPSGIILTRKRHADLIAEDIEYIKTPDVTIAGVRNGHTVLFLWHAIHARGPEGFKTEAETCIADTQYLHDELSAMGYPSFINPNSNIVVLKKPSDALVEKWDLACEDDWAHVVVMQHVTRKTIDRFLKDIINQETTS